jgi:hypothetical protein
MAWKRSRVRIPYAPPEFVCREQNNEGEFVKQRMRSSRFIIAVIAVSCVILAAAGWAWWRQVYTDPERVFDRMLASSLTTPSVTKKTSESSIGQSTTQISQLTVNPDPSVRTKATANQGSTTIEYETIAFPDREYFRYTNILTVAEDGAEPSTPDQYKDVMNIWGESSAASSGAEAQMFDQTMLGVVPMASLSPDDRQKLLAQIAEEKVYTVSYDSVKREHVGGRLTYTYNVDITPRAYVNMLKTFAEMVGSNQLADVDVSPYPDTPSLKVAMRVDVLSGNLIEIAFSEDARTETYSAHGGYQLVGEPEKSIPMLELQSMLQ